jgi:hypothetical protein
MQNGTRQSAAIAIDEVVSACNMSACRLKLNIQPCDETTHDHVPFYNSTEQLQMIRSEMLAEFTVFMTCGMISQDAKTILQCMPYHAMQSNVQSSLHHGYAAHCRYTFLFHSNPLH